MVHCLMVREREREGEGDERAEDRGKGKDMRMQRIPVVSLTIHSAQFDLFQNYSKFV